MSSSGGKAQPGNPNLIDQQRSQTWREFPKGHSRFAAFLANDPDKTTTIFRRFDRLGLETLLYLESEIAEIEHDLDMLDQQVLQDWNIERVPWQAQSQDWSLMKKAARSGDNAARRKVELTDCLSEKLKAYYKMLKITSEVMTLGTPDTRVLKATRHAFGGDRLDGSRKHKILLGNMENHLSEEKDLCVLVKSDGRDRLTRLFEGQFAWMFRPSQSRDDQEIIHHSTVELAVSIISTVLSGVLLIGAVLALYFITNPSAKLGALCGFTVVFASSLALLTNARRQDVFAATAAYVAVLVVFVSGNLSNGFDANTTATNGLHTITATVSTIVSTRDVSATTTRTLSGSMTSPIIVSVLTIPGSTNTVDGTSIGPITQTIEPITFYPTQSETSTATSVPASGLSGSAIAGISVGAGILLIFLGIGAVWYSTRLKRKGKASTEETKYHRPEIDTSFSKPERPVYPGTGTRESDTAVMSQVDLADLT